MPQYIEVAVVATDESGFKTIRDVPALSKTGVYPCYKLVTIGRPEDSSVTQISELELKCVGLWVALDDQAMTKCQSIFSELSSAPGYSRGFYDDLLPRAVIQVQEREEFVALTEMILEAFCESS